MENTQPRTRISNSLVFLLFVFTIVSTTLGVFHYFWLQSFYASAREATFRLAQNVGSVAASGEIDDRLWSEFVAQENEVAYLVSSYEPRNYHKSFFYPQEIHRASVLLEGFLEINGEEEMAHKLLRSGAGFPGEYLHVVSANLVPSLVSNESESLGVVKVGYVIPGRAMGQVPLGRGYVYVLYLLFALTGVLYLVAIGRSSMAYRMLRALRESPSGGAHRSGGEDSELTWVEDETGRTEPIYIDEKGRSWKILLPDGNSADWSKNGNWYQSNGDIVGRPWGASAVYPHVSVFGSYTYQLRAFKMAGRDGFILLFPVGDYQLSWVIGGWNNSKTEIAGYPNTSNPFRVEKNEWYFIEVRVGKNELMGLINGEVNWKIAINEIKQSSPEAGFQKGIGVGVWNTLVRYGDIRLLQE